MGKQICGIIIFTIIFVGVIGKLSGDQEMANQQLIGYRRDLKKFKRHHEELIPTEDLLKKLSENCRKESGDMRCKDFYVYVTDKHFKTEEGSWDDFKKTTRSYTVGLRVEGRTEILMTETCEYPAGLFTDPCALGKVLEPISETKFREDLPLKEDVKAAFDSIESSGKLEQKIWKEFQKDISYQ